MISFTASLPRVFKAATVKKVANFSLNVAQATAGLVKNCSTEHSAAAIKAADAASKVCMIRERSSDLPNSRFLRAHSLLEMDDYHNNNDARINLTKTRTGS